MILPSKRNLFSRALEHFLWFANSYSYSYTEKNLVFKKLQKYLLLDYYKLAVKNNSEINFLLDIVVVI